MNSRLKQSGVTLVELAVVVTIAAILMAIGIPSYKYVTTSNRIAGEINGLLGDMQFARYEAIKEGLNNVTICPAATSTSTACDTTSTTWSEGWIVLSSPGTYNSSTSVVLRRQVPFSNFNSNDTLTSVAGITYLGFNREGFVTPPTGVAAGPTYFSLHDPTNNAGFTRCLMVSTAGAMTTITSGKAMNGETCS